MYVNCQLWAFFFCAIFATNLAAQTPEAKRAPETPKATADQKAEQKTKRSEPPQSTATRKSAQEQENGGQSPLKQFYASEPTDDSAFAKRDAAQKTLVALGLAIQSTFSSGIDSATIKTREDELRTQLMEAKKDSDFDEVTSKAATLLAEITREASKPPIQVQAAAGSADHAPRASPQLGSSRGNMPLILSIVSLIISIFALIAGPVITRKAIAKTLRSAGLK